jgi:hypothetical protein
MREKMEEAQSLPRSIDTYSEMYCSLFCMLSCSLWISFHKIFLHSHIFLLTTACVSNTYSQLKLFSSHLRRMMKSSSASSSPTARLIAKPPGQSVVSLWCHRILPCLGLTLLSCAHQLFCHVPLYWFLLHPSLSTMVVDGQCIFLFYILKPIEN